MNTEISIIEGKQVKYKKLSLNNQLNLPNSYIFPFDLLKKLNQIELYDKFNFNNNQFTMTKLMKKRIIVKLDQVSGYIKKQEKILLTF